MCYVSNAQFFTKQALQRTMTVKHFNIISFLSSCNTTAQFFTKQALQRTMTVKHFNIISFLSSCNTTAESRVEGPHLCINSGTNGTMWYSENCRKLFEN